MSSGTPLTEHNRLRSMRNTGGACEYSALQDAVDTFIKEARRFCTLMELPSSPQSGNFAPECLRSVLRLYERATTLPLTELPAAVPIPDRLNSNTWEATRSRVGQKLTRDYYWMIFEPLVTEPPEATLGSLSDDLADIWRELKVGLIAWDTHTERGGRQAIWHWRLSFETHWSRHAAHAIVALNALCFGEFADTDRA